MELSSPDAHSGNAVTFKVDGGAELGTLSLGGQIIPGSIDITVGAVAKFRRVVGEILPGKAVVQTFVSSSSGIKRLDVLLASYARDNNCDLSVKLENLFSNDVILLESIQCAAVGSVTWVGFDLPRQADTKAGTPYKLTLLTNNATSGNAVTALALNQASLQGSLSYGSSQLDGELEFLISYDLKSHGFWSAELQLMILLALALAFCFVGGLANWTLAAVIVCQAVALSLTLHAYLANLQALFFCTLFFWALGNVAVSSRFGSRFKLALQRTSIVLSAMALALLLYEVLDNRKQDISKEVIQLALEQKKLHQFYSFESGAKDPERFASWWNYFSDEWFRSVSGIRSMQIPDPRGLLPFLVRPNSEIQFFGSVIATNSLGLRNRALDSSRQDVFRILVIGESTTMGQTIYHDDLPWPNVLEKKLSHLEIDGRRIEVINAGWAAYNIENNVVRMKSLLSDVDPNLVISYHGYNGFPLILQELPNVVTASHSVIRQARRPSILLARVEYTFKLLGINGLRGGENESRPLNSSASAKYRDAYEDLIEVLSRADVPLILATFNMSVNRKSKADVVDFYSLGFPRVLTEIEANYLHNEMARELAEKKQNVIYADTSHGLDGVHSKYVDLVHFTQAGRDQLASNLSKVIEAHFNVH